MENSAEYFTISIPCEIADLLLPVKNRYYCGVSQNEMITDLIRRGLGFANVTPPPQKFKPINV